MTYAEKLKDPRWQKKRLKIMERDHFMCVECRDSESTLNVDHKYYRKNLDPWAYPDDALQTLCENCHRAYGELRQTCIEALGNLCLFDIELVKCVIPRIPRVQNDDVLIMFWNTVISVPASQFESAIKKLEELNANQFPNTQGHSPGLGGTE